MSALRKRIEAVLRDRAASPRTIHRALHGRYELIAGELRDMAAEGLVTFEEGAGNRRVYTLVTGDEATFARRSRKLLAAIRSAGSMPRSDAYRAAGVGTAAELDDLLARLAAEGLVLEDANRRLRPAPADRGLTSDAERVLVGIQDEREDGLNADQCADLLCADARAAIGELVRAGLVVVHEDAGWRWFVAEEFDAPDPGPESPDWAIYDKAALVVRRIMALGPQREAAIVAAAAYAGIPPVRPGDVERIAELVGLVERDGLWHVAIAVTPQQQWHKGFALRGEDRRQVGADTDTGAAA